MTFKIAYHPDGWHSIVFDEGPHIYTDNRGVRYTSGTSFIKRYFPDFDTCKVAGKCSAGVNPKYAGRNPEEIKNEWRQEAYRGQTEGTCVHEYAETLMCGWASMVAPDPISPRCKKLFRQVDICAAWLMSRYDVLGCEMIVFCPTLKIAGMIDLLMYDRQFNSIVIFDWKQNKRRPSTKNLFQNAYRPIEHLQDTDINHYTLQLSLYQYILQSNNYFPDVSAYRRVLIHLSPKKHEYIPLPDYRYEITEMIKYERRQQQGDHNR